MSESNFSSKVVKWLRAKGCYVITTTVLPGVPTGCPDVIALLPSGRWAALEVKKDAKAKFQPLQKMTIARLNAMGCSRSVYPENWIEVQRELEQII